MLGVTLLKRGELRKSAIETNHNPGKQAKAGQEFFARIGNQKLERFLKSTLVQECTFSEQSRDESCDLKSMSR
jgi:hypothetical protein